MKKIILIFFATILLAGCTNSTLPEIPLDNFTQNIPQNSSFTLSQKIENVDFEFEILTAQNFSQKTAEFDKEINSNIKKTQIFLTLNNHRFNFSDFDFAKNSKLDEKPAENWEILDQKMGGHHIGGILTFPKTENPQKLSIDKLEIGKVNLKF